MRIAIKTLGCKVNQSDTAQMKGMLRERGYEIVSELEETPDVVIINTCSVTAKSDYQSRQLIRRAVNSGAQVIATGCYAQTRPDDILKIQGVKMVLGNSQKEMLPDYIDKLSSGDDIPLKVTDFSGQKLSAKPYYSGKTRAFLKIQDGCNSSCSYCTVPKARGKSRSLVAADVLKDAERFSSEGYKEIVLTGIHIGSYGLDLEPQNALLNIVNELTASFPMIRFRLSSIEPQEFKREFLDLIKSNALCPHLHIPLQSGSDSILRKMNRGYKASYFREVIEGIITKCPDISIGTDVIAGFPGENINDFENTLKLIEELPFSYVHVFPYSKRPDTKAESFDGQIAHNVIKKRTKILMDIAQKKKSYYITTQLGTKLDVIVERQDKTPHYFRAISGNYIKPIIQSESLHKGQRLSVRAVLFANKELICIPS